MPDIQEPKDKNVEAVEGQPTVKPSGDSGNEAQESKAAAVLLEAEGGGEEERVREAMKKRFVLLAEDDPRLGVLEDEARAAGVEEAVWAMSLDKVKEGADAFISKVERGELDQTILTMIADLEYPKVENGWGNHKVGIEGIKYVQDAVAKYNLAHPDRPLQVEVILNSTMSGRDIGGVDAISPGKEEAVKKLLEMIKAEK